MEPKPEPQNVWYSLSLLIQYCRTVEQISTIIADTKLFALDFFPAIFDGEPSPASQFVWNKAYTQRPHHFRLAKRPNRPCTHWHLSSLSSNTLSLCRPRKVVNVNCNKILIWFNRTLRGFFFWSNILSVARHRTCITYNTDIWAGEQTVCCSCRSKLIACLYPTVDHSYYIYNLEFYEVDENRMHTIVGSRSLVARIVQVNKLIKYCDEKFASWPVVCAFWWSSIFIIASIPYYLQLAGKQSLFPSPQRHKKHIARRWLWGQLPGMIQFGRNRMCRGSTSVSICSTVCSDLMLLTGITRNYSCNEIIRFCLSCTERFTSDSAACSVPVLDVEAFVSPPHEPFSFRRIRHIVPKSQI